MALPDGRTSLTLTAITRHAAMVKLLLDRRASWEELLNELQSLFDALLSGAIPPADDPGERHAVEEPEPQPTLLAGDRSTTGHDKLRRLDHILQDLGIAPPQFQGLPRAVSLPGFAKARLDLNASACLISSDIGPFAIEFLCLDSGDELPPALLFTDWNFENMLTDFLDHPRAPRLTSGDMATLMHMALMIAAEPGHPVIDLQAFRSVDKEKLERTPHPQGYWRVDRILQEGMAYRA